MILKIFLFLLMAGFVIDGFSAYMNAASVMHQILGSLSIVSALLVGIILSIINSRNK